MQIFNHPKKASPPFPLVILTVFLCALVAPLASLAQSAPNGGEYVNGKILMPNPFKGYDKQAVKPSGSPTATPTATPETLGAYLENAGGNQSVEVGGGPTSAGSVKFDNPPGTVETALPPLPTPASQFSGVVQNKIGVTPAQIKILHKKMMQRERAKSSFVSPPEPMNTVISASLDPGATPPVIRPFYGVSTAFSVVGKYGEKWPVLNVHNGNSALFNVSRLDGPKGSVFVVDALQPYGQSNLILKLKGEDTPLVITLVAGQDAYDSRAEVMVNKRGPLVPVSYNTGTALGVPGASGNLLSILDGVPPPGGNRLVVTGAPNTQAWVMNDNSIIVRGAFKLLSPFVAAVTSSDGTVVYKLPTTPKLLAIKNGQYMHITLSGW